MNTFDLVIIIFTFIAFMAFLSIPVIMSPDREGLWIWTKKIKQKTDTTSTSSEEK